MRVDVDEVFVMKHAHRYFPGDWDVILITGAQFGPKYIARIESGQCPKFVCQVNGLTDKSENQFMQ